MAKAYTDPCSVQFAKRKLLCGAPWKGLGRKNKVPDGKVAGRWIMHGGDLPVLSSPPRRQEPPYLLFTIGSAAITEKRELQILHPVTIHCEDMGSVRFGGDRFDAISQTKICSWLEKKSLAALISFLSFQFSLLFSFPPRPPPASSSPASPPPPFFHPICLSRWLRRHQPHHCSSGEQKTCVGVKAFSHFYKFPFFQREFFPRVE